MNLSFSFPPVGGYQNTVKHEMMQTCKRPISHKVQIYDRLEHALTKCQSYLDAYLAADTHKRPAPAPGLLRAMYVELIDPPNTPSPATLGLHLGLALRLGSVQKVWSILCATFSRSMPPAGSMPNGLGPSSLRASESATTALCIQTCAHLGTAAVAGFRGIARAIFTSGLLKNQQRTSDELNRFCTQAPTPSTQDCLGRRDFI